MTYKTKLGDLHYDILIKDIGKSFFYMHYDSTDNLRLVNSERALEKVKSELSKVYGNITVLVNSEKGKEVTILDTKWKEDYKKYIQDKLNWCNTYTAE